MEKTIENKLRKHFKPSLYTRLVSAFKLSGVGEKGKNIVIHKSSVIERFKCNMTLGDNMIIKSNAILSVTNQDAHLSIGRNTTVGFNTIIFSSVRVEIGENCMIAPNCYIVDVNHGIDRDSTMNSQPLFGKSVLIGDDVWLGADVKVMPGVSIGKGCVVGAGAVVTKSFPEYSIIAGVPAQIIGERQ